ncbi:hypothetical protein DO72_4460 [Burkholderia pseudomallei]|nr:hypothetical protein DP42_5019 [Burkholderia pseudomallei]KGD41911.1 hypothetical protein DO72_4460 [Burkholderia pseudomallei]KGD46560.1 hypothetical protein DP43_4794 [Burkholderia pseudomallei]
MSKRFLPTTTPHRHLHLFDIRVEAACSICMPPLLKIKTFEVPCTGLGTRRQ